MVTSTMRSTRSPASAVGSPAPAPAPSPAARRSAPPSQPASAAATASPASASGLGRQRFISASSAPRTGGVYRGAAPLQSPRMALWSAVALARALDDPAALERRSVLFGEPLVVVDLD